MILEFIFPATDDYSMPISTPVLGNFVGSLSPMGSEFFKGYIHMKPQFILKVDQFTEYYNKQAFAYIQQITD